MPPTISKLKLSNQLTLKTLYESYRQVFTQGCPAPCLSGKCKSAPGGFVPVSRTHGGKSRLPSMAIGCIQDIRVPNPTGGLPKQIGYPADLSGNPCRNSVAPRDYFVGNEIGREAPEACAPGMVRIRPCGQQRNFNLPRIIYRVGDSLLLVRF